MAWHGMGAGRQAEVSLTPVDSDLLSTWTASYPYTYKDRVWHR